MGIDLFKFYDMQWHDEDILIGEDDLPEYDICRLIVGVHRSHSIFLSKDKVRANERNGKYKKQLISEVIDKIKYPFSLLCCWFCPPAISLMAA